MGWDAARRDQTPEGEMPPHVGVAERLHGVSTSTTIAVAAIHAFRLAKARLCESTPAMTRRSGHFTGFEPRRSVLPLPAGRRRSPAPNGARAGA
jgi:hypothetical protein